MLKTPREAGEELFSTLIYRTERMDKASITDLLEQAIDSARAYGFVLGSEAGFVGGKGGDLAIGVKNMEELGVSPSAITAAHEYAKARR